MTYLRKTVHFMLIFILLISFNIPKNPVQASEKVVIRVGYPYVEGISEFDENGVVSGYAYEYLKEISKYTGWEYEFITGEDELQTLYSMLDTGEIDILAGAIKNNETDQKFDFPNDSCGTTFVTLSVLNKNTKFADSDYDSFQGMTVGAIQGTDEKIKKLKQFCKTNEITIEIKEKYNSMKELSTALDNGEIDAILSGDLVYNYNQKIIARFAAEPYYFAVSRNKKNILDGLNMAISKIKEVNVNYDIQLYNKYFPRYEIGPFSLNEEEKEFIKNLEPLRVVSGSHNLPFDYFDDQGQYKGITKDIFEEISAMTGLTFQYLEAKNGDEAYDMVKNGEADILTPLYDEPYFLMHPDLTLITPFLSMPMVLIKKKDMQSEEIGDARLGISRGYNLIEDLRNENSIQYYNTVEECMLAVEAGDIDYCYANSYSAEYYQRSYALRNIDMVILPDSNRWICFGIKEPVDAMLLGILNKSVQYISDSKKQEIIFENTSAIQYKISFVDFLRLHVVGTLITIFIIVLLAFALLVIVFQKKRHVEEREIIRYRLLSHLTNEILFEYDFIKDRLTISETGKLIANMKTVTEHYMRKLKNGELEYSQEVLHFIKQCEKNSDLKEDCEFTTEFKWQHHSGEVLWYRVTYVYLMGKNGKLEFCLGRLRDISMEMEEKDKLVEMARRDTLTGLYNKGASVLLCQEYLKDQGKKQIHAFMIADIDNFKYVNDTYGHKCGDEALKKAADLLRRPFRSIDVIGRIGGDEFTIFIKDLRSTSLVLDKASDIIKFFQSIQEIDGYPISLSVSIGVAFYPQDGTNYDDLYKKADLALYEAKRNGKSNFRFYDEKMSENGWKPFKTSAIDSDEEEK